MQTAPLHWRFVNPDEAEVSGLDLRRLASYQDLKITADQQCRILDALGLDVTAE